MCFTVLTCSGFTGRSCMCFMMCFQGDDHLCVIDHVCMFDHVCD